MTGIMKSGSFIKWFFNIFNFLFDRFMLSMDRGELFQGNRKSMRSFLTIIRNLRVKILTK